MNQAIWLVFIQTAMVTERPSDLVQGGLFPAPASIPGGQSVSLGGYRRQPARLFGFYRRNKNFKSLLTIAHHEASPASTSEYQRQISIW